MDQLALWKVNLEEASGNGGSLAELFVLTPSEAHPPAQIAERFEKLHSPDCTVYRIDRITCLGVLPTAWIERHDFTRQIRELIDDANRSD